MHINIFLRIAEFPKILKTIKKTDSFRNSETVKTFSQTVFHIHGNGENLLRTPRFTKMVSIFPKFMEMVKVFSRIPKFMKMMKLFSQIPKFSKTVNIFRRVPKCMETVKIYSQIPIFMETVKNFR